MLKALIDVCNKHRPPDANWIEVRRSENHAHLVQIFYGHGEVGSLMDTSELVQFAEVLIQAGTLRAVRGDVT